ncbi:DUF2079 domain-containing protein [Synechococcus sp. BS55D]|uniref:DUF2079 domain-containing protein n=1 Tax=Synechococcus sp. BS55D TaxID=2055943 RepID=UPI00103E34CD|nr:DUF2079 domain-containing protein [Synechococcus sp. BS55D]TCD55135.1 hypothetical protein CWE16_11945 [Synechococcus sp. BS55D]
MGRRAVRSAPPWSLSLGAALVGLILWGTAALRHHWLQSNAYDLGLFDQWAWLIGNGLPPISSMEGVHVMADHGAWLFYAAGAAYALLPSTQWLLASQAMALAFTALPIWMLGQQAGLSPRRCWLACLLWWLQPVVFNAALFDFHPETWVMPVLALSIWAARDQRPLLWFALLLLLLGARDGLVLITAGIALEQAWHRRWRWSLTAALLSSGWLLLLSRWLYPWLRDGEGPKAAGRMFNHLLGPPLEVLGTIDWSGGGLYLLLLALPCLWLWRRRSLPTLLIALPLLLTNLLSASPSYRTLIHHYSLPLAVVAVVAAIDGLLHEQPERPRSFPWTLSWAVACWLALAKPWFFTEPYLSRMTVIPEARSAMALVSDQDAVLTTSYLAPQLSRRSIVAFVKKGSHPSLTSGPWTLLLLHPKDPGWGSNRSSQQRLLDEADALGWQCQRWPSGLTLCQQGEAMIQRDNTKAFLFRNGNVPL